MIWTPDANGAGCPISSGLTARVWESAMFAPWAAQVQTADGYSVWRMGGYADEAAAKAAVCHWIGRTMAQFSNALAQGFEQPDDGC